MRGMVNPPASDPTPSRPVADRGWQLLGIRIAPESADAIAAACTGPREASGAPRTVACANLHSMAVASRDPAFAAALRASTFVTADGAPLRVAGRVLGEPVGPRVTGYDVFEAILARLDRERGSAMFVGSTPAVLGAMRERASRDYPGVSVEVHAPPFGDLSGAPTERILAEIGRIRPTVVFVGMSAPKQEVWAAACAGRAATGAIVCVGAVFDYYARTLRRAPAWARHAGLEWLYRLLQEPRRVWRKYFVSGPIFVSQVAREWGRRRFLGAPS